MMDTPEATTRPMDAIKALRDHHNGLCHMTTEQIIQVIQLDGIANDHPSDAEDRAATCPVAAYLSARSGFSAGIRATTSYVEYRGGLVNDIIIDNSPALREAVHQLDELAGLDRMYRDTPLTPTQQGHRSALG